MAVNRCFDTFNKNKSSSDYANIRRQKTLYIEINKNINCLNTGNPVKRDSFNYNNNFGIISSSDESKYNSCLATAKSYDLLLDITKGKNLVNSHCGNTDSVAIPPKYDSWSGNLFSVNYKDNSVDNVVNTQNATDPSYNIVDPSYSLFYNDYKNNECPLTELSGYPPNWLKVVDISFNNTSYYKEAQKARLLYNFNYPEKVTFGSIIP